MKPCCYIKNKQVVIKEELPNLPTTITNQPTTDKTIDNNSITILLSEKKRMQKKMFWFVVFFVLQRKNI